MTRRLWPERSVIAALLVAFICEATSVQTRTSQHQVSSHELNRLLDLLTAPQPKNSQGTLKSGRYLRIYEGMVRRGLPDLLQPPGMAKIFSFKSLRNDHPPHVDDMKGFKGAEPDIFVKQLFNNMELLSEMKDPQRDRMLAQAIEDISDRIVDKAVNIRKGKAWINKVSNVIKLYVDKTKRVSKHTKKLVMDLQMLLRKQRQINNMITQRKLQQKMEYVQADLTVVRAALQNIGRKDATFTGTEKDIKSTIGSMEDVLKQYLRKRKKPKKKKQKRQNESSGSSESSSSSSAPPPPPPPPPPDNRKHLNPNEIKVTLVAPPPGATTDFFASSKSLPGLVATTTIDIPSAARFRSTFEAVSNDSTLS